MASPRTDLALLTSLALDGELPADDAARFAAARNRSNASKAQAQRIESAHRQLQLLRTSVAELAGAPATWATQLFDALRERLQARGPSRRRLPEVFARDATHAEDLELAQAALAGDDMAQREIYFGHIALVQHLLRTRRLGAFRDDIAQDIFFRVFGRLHTYRGDSSLKTWIHRVAVNHITNVLTRDLPKRARELTESQLDTPDGAPSVIDAAVDTDVLQDDRVMQTERRAIVAAALSRLPAAARTVVELKEIDGLTCEEIAAMLSVPMGTVQSRLARGRARLAAFLTADERAASA